MQPIIRSGVNLFGKKRLEPEMSLALSNCFSGQAPGRFNIFLNGLNREPYILIFFQMGLGANLVFPIEAM